MDGVGNNTGLIVIGAVVGVIVVAVIVYYVARTMKGSLKLALNQKGVTSGDKITGSLMLVAKKHILADRLYIGLIGEREERRRSSNGNTQTRWVEFYRDESDILIDQQLNAGFQETYQFELNTPSEGQVMTGAGALSKIAESMEDGVTKSLVSGLGSLASLTGGGRRRWKVIARLETKGVDLAASQGIHVSLKSAAPAL